MIKYVITVTDNDKIRTLKNTFADFQTALEYVTEKYHRAKQNILTSAERRNGTLCKYTYKRYGENNRISIYTIKIHKIVLEGDVCNEEKKDS